MSAETAPSALTMFGFSPGFAGDVAIEPGAVDLGWTENRQHRHDGVGAGEALGHRAFDVEAGGRERRKEQSGERQSNRRKRGSQDALSSGSR